MLTIGITAGIGAGKSEVLHYLEDKYGAYVIETDKLGHNILDRNDVIDILVNEFGGDILGSDDKVDRIVLGKKCFDDSLMLKKLNAIIHPLVRKEIFNSMNIAKEKGYRLYVVEAALLIEGGYKSELNYIWYIGCDKAMRIKRLMANRGLSYEKCLSIIDKQLSETEFIKSCDIVIDNSTTIEALHKNVDSAIKEILPL